MAPTDEDDGTARRPSSFAARLKSTLLGASSSAAARGKPDTDLAANPAAPTAYRFGLRDGREVAVEIALPPPVSDRPATFIFGIYKGGSTLLNRMVGEVLRETRRRAVNLPNMLRQEGWNIEDVVVDVDGLFENRGIVFGGFRDFPGLLMKSASLAPANKILLVRDPRDILVSLYFSHAYSHTVPTTGTAKEKTQESRQRALATDPDSYALENAEGLRSDLLTLSRLLGENTTLVRYEDVIFDKPKIANTICDVIGLDVAPDALAEIAARNDIRPEKEDKHAHIRNVSPGDHKQKLKPETIAELNQFMQPVFEIYYPELLDKPA